MNVFEKTETKRTWDYTAGCYQYSFQFAFADRTQYLEFRSCWRENYHFLSADIRALKRTTRESQRLANRTVLAIALQPDIAVSQPHRAIEAQRVSLAASQLQQALHTQREEARKQMQMRRASKGEAQRQYVARKAIGS